MDKLVIANIGTAYTGKSSSVKEVFSLLATRYPNNITIFHSLESGDVKAIIDVQGVQIGIESQGDPNSRLFQSLDDFQRIGCSIIVTACRTYGRTTCAVEEMHQYGYRIIWSPHDKSWDDSKIKNYLNSRYAEHIVQIIEDWIDGKL